MADILIKGMEMPTSCQKCPFLDYEEGFCFASGTKGGKGWYEFTFCPGEIKGGKHDDCPLVPIPPHGDLVDRDEIIEAGKSHPTYKNSKIVKAVVDKACCFLKTATVVIPANKEG